MGVHTKDGLFDGRRSFFDLNKSTLESVTKQVKCPSGLR